MTEWFPKVIKPLLPLYTSNHRYVILYGGRGGAKSFGVSQYMLTKSFQTGFKGLVLRQTLSVTDESVKAQLQSVAEHEKVDGKFTHIASRSTNIQSGNTISFMGFQTSSKLQNAKMKSLADFTHVWIEEADEVKEEDFDKLDASIRMAGVELKIILSFNTPHSKHWIKDAFFKPDGTPQKRDDVLYIHTTYLDLKEGMVADSFLALAEKTKQRSVDKYNHVFLGHWQDESDDQIYSGWKTIPEFPEHIPFLYGLDFGFNHPTAIVKVGIDGNSLFVQQMLYKSNLLPSERIAFCLSLGPAASIVADSAAADAIAEMRHHRIRTIAAVKGPNSVLKGIEDIQDMDVFVVDGSPDIWNEFYEYRWIAHGVPKKEDDDAMDAIRYTVKQLKRGNREKRYSVA